MGVVGPRPPASLSPPLRNLLALLCAVLKHTYLGTENKH